MVNGTGGGDDTLSRFIAPHLGRVLGADILVESRGGAAGVIGVRAIRDAIPDGLTLGLINAAGFVAPILAGDRTVPNPTTDLTVLCRISRSRHVWAARMDSPLRSMQDVLKLSRERPVVFPISDLGAVAFISATLTSNLLDLPVKLVAGYEGSRSGVLAALRGEVDLISYNLESIIENIRNRDIRPLLQISDKPLSGDPAFENVPLLGGPDGMAAAHAGSIHHDVEAAKTEATAIAALLGAGRIVVGPPRMNRDLSVCLTNKLKQVLASPDLLSVAEAANVSLDVADGGTALAEFADLDQKSRKFIPIIQSAIERIRQ